MARPLDKIHAASKQTWGEACAVVVAAQKTGELLCVEVSDGSGHSVNAYRWKPTKEGLEAAVRYADDLWCRWTAVQDVRIASRAPSEHDAIQ